MEIVNKELWIWVDIHACLLTVFSTFLIISCSLYVLMYNYVNV